MANVFLSYAREDSARAAIIAKALSRRWTVWWGSDDSPGQDLRRCHRGRAQSGGVCGRPVVQDVGVVHWVRSEAAEGARRGILVPAFLEAAKIPLEFRRVQAANLTAWNGDPADPEFEQFIRSISTLIEAEAPTLPPIASRRIAEPAFDTFASLPRPAAPEHSGRPHGAAHMRSLASRPSPSLRRSGAVLPGGRRPGRQRLRRRRKRPTITSAPCRRNRTRPPSRPPIPVSPCHRSLACAWMPRGRNSNASG